MITAIQLTITCRKIKAKSRYHVLVLQGTNINPVLKALCHTIRADCQLLEAATCTHKVNEQCMGVVAGWLIHVSSHARLNLATEACSAGCSTSEASYRLLIN